MHTLQHTLTQAQRTRTLAQVKLVAGIANLDVDEYIKTASNEYLKVTIRSADTIYAKLCVYVRVRVWLCECMCECACVYVIHTHTLLPSRTSTHTQVKSISADGRTLSVVREAEPAGLIKSRASPIAAGSTLTLAEGGVNASGTTLHMVAALPDLGVGDYIKSAQGEYMQVQI